jgi:hypothetical protein
MSTKYLDYGVSSPRAMIGRIKVPIRLNYGHPTGTSFDRALAQEGLRIQYIRYRCEKSGDGRAFVLAN